MANISTNQGYFKYRGVSSMDMNVFMLEMPTRPTPAARGESVDIPAVDGKLWIPEGTFERITVKVKVECGSGADIDAINAWLVESGDLIFMDEPDKCYHARVIKGIDRTHSDKRRINRTWTQVWDCEPFRYQSTPVSPIKYTTTAEMITNPGTIESKPLLKISCDGDGALMIGGVNTLFVTDYHGILYVDCDAKIAYSGEGTALNPYMLANSHVSGDWCVIPPGANGVMFSGNIEWVEITPRWRWV